MSESEDYIKPRYPLKETPEDGSAMFTQAYTTYLFKHLSVLDVELLHHEVLMGRDFSYLTERKVVDMFL